MSNQFLHTAALLSNNNKVFLYDSFNGSQHPSGYLIEYLESGNVEITSYSEKGWENNKNYWCSIGSDKGYTYLWSIPCFGGEMVKDKFDSFINSFFSNPMFKKADMEQSLRLRFNWELPEIEFFDI